MRELSLFTGAGGGLLGTKLLGFTPVGYIEFNDYCQRVLAQRIKDGHLERAPIFSDVREFLESGAAEQYQGIADVVTGGFPCQPFSVAGKGLGVGDPRNMWPQTIEVIRRVRPRFALLENVPGLLNHEYTKRIFGDLAEAGFNARWKVISAAECGAPHLRKRVWIMADSISYGEGRKADAGKLFVTNESGTGVSQRWNGVIKEYLCGEIPDPQSQRRREARTDSERPSARATSGGAAPPNPDLR